MYFICKIHCDDTRYYFEEVFRGMGTMTNANEIWDHETRIGVKSGKRKKNTREDREVEELNCSSE